MKTKVYIHVAVMNNWEAILSEILEDLRISKLDKEAEVTLVAVGGTIGSYGGCRVINTGKPINTYEIPTLQLIYDELEESRIMYCHLKGVSRPFCLYRRDWRREMCNFCIIDWETRLLHLKVRYTSGPRITNSGAGDGSDYVPAYKHYSGNFWWARSDYLKKLPPPEQFFEVYKNRFTAETWVGQSSKINEYIEFE